MQPTILILPGLHGSGPGHWQTWMEAQLPQARRITDIDWDSPVLDRWTTTIRRDLDLSFHPPWIVAHSFGCLAGVAAAASRPGKVAGLMLVALADPERFTPFGVRDGWSRGLAERLPHARLEFPSVVVASTSDLWIKFEIAAEWAERWGSYLIDLGSAGHINVASGYGPWPMGLELLQTLQRAPAEVRTAEACPNRLPPRPIPGASSSRNVVSNSLPDFIRKGL